MWKKKTVETLLPYSNRDDSSPKLSSPINSDYLLTGNDFLSTTNTLTNDDFLNNGYKDEYDGYDDSNYKYQHKPRKSKRNNWISRIGQLKSFILLLLIKGVKKVNKFNVCLFIISLSFILVLIQAYIHLAFFNAAGLIWNYLEKSPYENFNSDQNIVDLIKTFKNSDNLEILSSYYTSSNNLNNDLNDVRLAPAVYINNILNNLLLQIDQNDNNKGNDFSINSNYNIDFSWLDWINFDRRLSPSLEFLTKFKGEKLKSCNQFSESIGFPRLNFFRNDYLSNCVDLEVSEINSLSNKLYPNFKITGPLDDYTLPIDARIIHGASYIYHEMPSPSRLVFVDGKNKLDLILPINDNNGDKNSRFNKQIDNKLYDFKQIDSIDILMTKLNDLVNKYNIPIYKISDNSISVNNNGIIYDIPRIHKNANVNSKEILKLKDNDEFENFQNFHSIKKRIPNYRIENSLDYKFFKNIKEQHELYPYGNYPKYFHESNINNKKIGGSHFDWRFFNMKEKEYNNEFKRISVLNRLIKAWLRFTNNENIKTWIAHGTLLGYSFNEKMLPWDFDHDVQITSKSLWYLAQNFNQSIIIDSTINDDEYSTGFGQYFLDISNNFFNRYPINDNNAIDARFIDIQTGMYIDITEVTRYHENKRNEIIVNEIDELSQSIKTEFYRFLKTNRISVNEIIDKNVNLYGCKNHHFYTFEEIEELKLSKFQGIDCYIPLKFNKILDREFPKRKTIWNMEGYTWRSDLFEWVGDNKCSKGKRDRLGTSCLSNSYVTNVLVGEEASAVDWEALVLVNGVIAEIGNRR